MRILIVLSVLSSVLVLPAHASAPEEFRASGLEQVAFVPILETSHLEFMTRTIDGVEHTFVLLGSRDTMGGEGAPAEGGLHVIDVTNPDDPVRAAFVRCTQDDNDIAWVNHPQVVDGVSYDGFIVLSSNSSGGCFTGVGRGGPLRVLGIRSEPLPGEIISLSDLGTDLVAPNATRFPWESQAAHTIVAHPTEPLVYVASQRFPDRAPSVEIADFSVWPPVVTSVDLPPTGINPHDITFRPDGKRAYVSSINLSFVWDTTNPRQPTSISMFGSPNLKVHHEAVLHPNGRHLFVVDEFVNTTSGGVAVCPGGGVHVFDLGPDHLFEGAPVPVGQLYASEVSAPVLDEAPEIDIGCTAHEFNFTPDGRRLVIGWTGAGTRVFDLEWDPLAMPDAAVLPMVATEVAHHVPFLTDAYASKTHPNTPGYIFSSDTQLHRNPTDPVGGLRVLKLTDA